MQPKRVLVVMAVTWGVGVAGGGTAAWGAVPTWPEAREVWVQGFDGSTLDDFWEDQGEGRIQVSPAASHDGAGGGLAVDVSGESQTYLQRFNLDDWPHLEFPRDTYIRLELHPNGVSIPAGETVALLRLRDADWNVLGGLRLAAEAGAYVVYLELPDGSFDPVALPVSNDWHTVVLGCRPNDWLGVWVDDTHEQVVSGLSHGVDFVQVLILGKGDGNWNGQTPSGTLYIDEVTLLYASYPELWVDAAAGDDANEGDTAGAPLQTLQQAVTLAGPGTVIHVEPGDYRESVTVPTDGTEAAPIRLHATGGRSTARILGSNPASDATWTRLTDPAEIDLPAGVDPAVATIWKADLSAWELSGPPRFVMRPGASGWERLPNAREPDWHVETEHKHHEFWWAAEGGDGAVTCDPVAVPDCDEPNRSDSWLTDASDDPAPAGIEPGNLASLGDVTGAIMYVKGTNTGHYMYRRRVAETAAGGRVRLEALPEAYTDGCWFDHDPSRPNLGWHSKYYLEGLAKFLDTPGEWHFDEATQTLYVWTVDGQSPDQLGLEISVRERGVDLSHRSFIELVDLDVLFFADESIRISGSGSEDDFVYGITLSGLDIGWSTRGLHMAHGPEPGTAAGSQTRGFTLRDSRIHHMESLAIYFWTGSGADFARPGITDVRIFHNELDHIGFRDNEQGGVGMSFQHADHFLFQGNHVHHIAHNGVVFSKAQTQNSPGHHVAPADILTGDILVLGNLFENCVQNATDAGGLKFWGANADRSHTFRDALVMGNVSRNNVGWAWVSEARQNWTYNGRGGMGYYVDYAGGVHFFRNIAYENGLAGFMASGSWMDQGAVLVNNTIVNSPRGYTMGVRSPFNDENAQLVISNTIFLHTQQFALSVGDERLLTGNVTVDHNLYHLVGYEDWPQHNPGVLAGHVDGTGYRELPTLAEVQAELSFELSGVEGDPQLAGFDPSVTDGSWQDFRLTPQSDLALDTGGPLPASLVALLDRFGLEDGQHGAALDRGAIELDPDNPDAPYDIDVGPGDGSAPISTPWGEDFPDPEVEPPDEASGCGCRSAGGTSAAGWLLLLGLLWWIRRRRRGGPG